MLDPVILLMSCTQCTEHRVEQGRVAGTPGDRDRERRPRRHAWDLMSARKHQTIKHHQTPSNHQIINTSTKPSNIYKQFMRRIDESPPHVGGLVSPLTMGRCRDLPVARVVHEELPDWESETVLDMV